MTEQIHPTAIAEPRPDRRRRGLLAVLRWLYRIVGSITILAAAFLFIAQTDAFRHWLKNRLVAAANAALEAELSIGDLHIDLFRGVVIDAPKLRAHDTDLFTAKRVSVSYDLGMLFDGVIALYEVHLDQPSIRLEKDRAGVWNLDRIVKPSRDTTPSAPPDLSIIARSIRLSNGSVIVQDHSTSADSLRAFDPLHLHLADVNLDATLRLALRRHDMMVALNACSFRQVGGPLRLRNLATVVHATPQGINVPSLHVQTVNSDVYARAKIDGIDLFNGMPADALAQHPIVGSVTSKQVYGPDVTAIIPEVDLLGTYAIDADVVYSGTRVDVNNLRLRAGDGIINGAVRVDHLTGGQPLAIDIRVANSSARYEDVRQRLRFVPLPELPFLDRTSIVDLHLYGQPDHALNFVVHGSDRPGSVQGTMRLILDQPTLAYDLEVDLTAGDLSVFADDGGITSHLNGHVSMHGSGTSLDELIGVTTIDLRKSYLFGRPITSLTVALDAKGGGVITVDSLRANVAPFAVDSLDAASLLYLTPSLLAEQLIELEGEFDVSDSLTPRYMASIRTQDLNVASLTRNTSLPTLLTSQFTVNGRGLEVDEIYGSIDGSVSMLVLRDRALLPFNIDVVSTPSVGGRSIRVRSDFGSVGIDGMFRPSTMVRALSGAVSAVQDIIDTRLADFRTDVDAEDSLIIDMDPMDATIDLDLYETSPINLLLDQETVAGTARVTMRVKSTRDTVLIDIPQVYLGGLQIDAPQLEFYADPTSATARLEIVDLQRSARVANLHLSGSCDSVMRINDLTLRYPRVDLRESAGTASLNASSGINTMAASLQASLQTRDSSTVLAIDSASFTLNAERGLSWSLQHPSVVSLRHGVATIDSLLFSRAQRETIFLSGVVSSTTFSNTRVAVSGFPLREIPLFADLSSDDPLRLLDGMLQHATITMNGSWEQPDIQLELAAGDVTYNRATIGSLSTTLLHRYGNITGEAFVVDPRTKNGEHALDVTIGAIPLDLRFTPIDDRWNEEAPISIGMKAKGLALAAVEPFLPAVESVRGTADAAITISGTPAQIQLKGTGTFADSRFLASATNMVYSAQGAIHLENNTLFIDSVMVQNTDRDHRGGSALAHGVVVFKGLSADSIDFKVEAKTKTGVKVMNKASQARSPQLFGDLIIRTGTNPIRLYGKLESPRLTGDMVIRYADVIFPQERSTTKARRSLFTYARENPRSFTQRGIMEYANDTTPSPALDDALPLQDQQQALTDAASQAVRAILEEQSESFVDALKFDLNVFLEGRTLLTMNFGPLEILVADLEQIDRNVPLTFVGSFGDNSTNLRGSVRVKDGASTYKFYKPFRTSGELNFSAGGLTNPTLKLTAVYEDRRVVNERIEDYKVELAITGTKSKPKVGYRVWRNGREIVGDSAKVAGDALMLILVGRTQDELFAEGQGDLVGQVSSSLSAVATSALSDVISELGVFVQNAQLDIGADFTQSRLTLSGQLFGDVSYRVSGQIADLSGNSTFTITVPLSVLGDEDALRYLRADFSHTVNNSGNITRQSRLWEIKLGARLP